MLERDFHYFLDDILRNRSTGFSSFCFSTPRGYNFFIQTSNHAILVSTEISQSLESSHANEGDIEGHHIGEMITCFLRLHDDFADFSSISFVSTQ